MNTLINKIKNPDKYNFYYLQDVEIDDVIQVRKDKARYFVSRDGQIYRYAKNKKRYGYPVENTSKIIIEDKKNFKSAESQWKDSWVKVAHRLERSGFYSDILENIKLAFDIGYDKMQLAYELYWKEYKEVDYAEKTKKRDEEIRKLDERFLTKDGNVNTELVWRIKHPARIKKMNFGKYVNAGKLQAIKEAIQNKKEISVSSRTNYDISFTYNPKSNKASYSEEFKNCGNGHYYLALDETHALFYEDD